MVSVLLCVSAMDNLNGRVCPPFGKKAKFEVETIQTKSPMYGCAYLGNKTQLSTASLFHLWVERPVETKVHGHCNNMQSTYNKSLLHQNLVGRRGLGGACDCSKSFSG